ncbi:MAG: hypothetical protein ABF649_02945 [Bacillus sp. (in: firmicutes)]
MEEDVERIEEKEEEEEEDLIAPQQNTDHLTNFMFGTNYPARRRKEGKHDNNYIGRNNGDAWILGRNQKEEKQYEEEVEDDKLSAVTDFLDQIDIDLLMKNVDSFMTSANEFKPIIKKFAPLIKKWIK